MERSLGQLLDDPNDFFAEINRFEAMISVLKATVDVGLSEKLDENPQTIEELATLCDFPADKLQRLLFYLAAENVIDLLPDGRVKSTSRMRQLQELASTIDCCLASSEAASCFCSGIREGKTPYEKRFGKPVFAHLAEEPQIAAVFADFMGFLTRRVEGFIFSQHQFEPFQTACDVGGNHGALLLKLLEHHPGTNGILFDLPEVISEARSSIDHSAASERVQLVAGSFFEAVPAADLYLLKMILHDWADHECVAILKTVRAAIGREGRVAIIDMIMPEVPAPCEALDFDIAMMVWDTGRERKASEFETLFDASGFKLDRVSENKRGQSVIEAVPV